MQAKGCSYPLHGAWKGRQVMRVSVSGHMTRETHIDALVGDVADAWDAVRREVA